MTAQAPSSAEQATIDRLGIFDEEKFAEIIEHVDERPPCYAPGCDHVATHVLVTVCCKDKRLICSTCLARVERRWEETVGEDRVVCGLCGVKFPLGVSMCDVVEAVLL